MSDKIHWIAYEWRYTAVALGALVGSLLTFFFWVSGMFEPASIPGYFSSEREFQGMVLLFILIPTYFSICLVYGTRTSKEIAQSLDQTNETNLVQVVTTFPARLLLFFGFLGLLYGVIFNIPGMGLNFFEADTVERITIIGQVMIWTTMGVLLATRFRISRAFHKASAQVHADLFETTNLKPFARIGLIDVLFVVGALLISTVQALDFSFRPDNYYKALIIAVPSMLYLAIYPMWGLHQRLKVIRQQELSALADLIAQTPKALETTHINKLEILLQRLERVKRASTWPVDMAILQRFLFYIVIPPLAWVGAALVEFVIDGFIQG